MLFASAAGMMDTTQLPQPALFVEATARVASLPVLPPHPNVARFATHVAKIIKLLRGVADVKMTVDLTMGAPDEAAHEKSMVLLEALRGSVAVLVGYRAKILEREVSRFLPHEASKYVQAHTSALRNLKDLRAIVSFFTGETDDHDSGYDFVPPPPPPAPGPSVDFDFG